MHPLLYVLLLLRLAREKLFLCHIVALLILLLVVIRCPSLHPGGRSVARVANKEFALSTADNLVDVISRSPADPSNHGRAHGLLFVLLGAVIILPIDQLEDVV